MAGSLAAHGRGDSIASGAYPDARRQMGGLEGPVPRFELTPERPPARLLPPCQVFRRHPEGENMHMEAFLTTVQCGCDHAPDLVDHRIGHCETANRGAPAMHHQERTGSGVGPI